MRRVGLGQFGQHRESALGFGCVKTLCEFPWMHSFALLQRLGSCWGILGVWAALEGYDARHRTFTEGHDGSRIAA